jgi:UDPglucose 6-dehydrogenase
MNEKVSVIGLGKLGLNLAVCMASRGVDVLGVDNNPDTIKNIRSGTPPIFEPGLKEMLAGTVGNTLEVTNDISRCVTETSISFILVQTPSRADGRYSTEALESVLTPICRKIREVGKLDHAVVVCSTIQPGTFQDTILPLVRRESGFRNGHGIEVAYNPELVALGTAIRNFTAPDFVLIGADHPGAARRVEAIQRRLTTNDPPIHHMSLASAELVKLCLNTYLTVKISFANLVSQLASRIAGAEVDKICAAVGDDKRIGAKYFKAGPSFGGTCFPRDVRAFVRLCDDLGQDLEFARGIGRINQTQDQLLEELTLAALEDANARSVGILGMAFKPGTPIIDESPAVKLAMRLLELGYQVSFHDPEANSRAIDALGIRAEAHPNAASCVAAAPVVVLHHPTPENRDAILQAAPRLSAVIDCWGVFGNGSLPPNVSWLRLGNRFEPRETEPSRLTAS